jgi:hypothetical protein
MRWPRALLRHVGLATDAPTPKQDTDVKPAATAQSTGTIAASHCCCQPHRFVVADSLIDVTADDLIKLVEEFSRMH